MGRHSRFRRELSDRPDVYLRQHSRLAAHGMAEMSENRNFCKKVASARAGQPSREITR
jgi:hypothetical protein